MGLFKSHSRYGDTSPLHQSLSTLGKNNAALRRRKLFQSWRLKIGMVEEESEKDIG
jgi:hypothetical protein